MAVKIYRCLVGMHYGNRSYRRNDLLYSDQHNHIQLVELEKKGRIVEVPTTAPPDEVVKPSEILPGIVKQALEDELPPKIVTVKPVEHVDKPARRAGRPPGSHKK